MVLHEVGWTKIAADKVADIMEPGDFPEMVEDAVTYAECVCES